MENAEIAARMGGKVGGAEGVKSILTALPDDADFRAVANAWTTLPAALKAGILAMVKAAALEGKT